MHARLRACYQPLHNLCGFFSVFFLENKAVGVMKVGHTFTIEPMISEGNFHPILFSLFPPSAH